MTYEPKRLPKSIPPLPNRDMSNAYNVGITNIAKMLAIPRELIVEDRANFSSATMDLYRQRYLEELSRRR